MENTIKVLMQIRRLILHIYKIWGQNRRYKNTRDLMWKIGNWPLGLSIPDTEPGQSLLKACSSGPEHDDHREEDLRRSEHVATKEEVMAVMEGSYRERSGGGSLVGVISCLTWTWRRSRWCCCGEGEANQTAVSWGGGERRRGQYNCEATLFWNFDFWNNIWKAKELLD